MDNKKAFLIIFLATALALVITLLIKPKEEKTILNNEQPAIENLESEKNIDSEAFESNNNSENESQQEDVKIEVKPKELTNPQTKISKEKDSMPIFEKLEVKEEYSKVEEAGVYFEDPGILNENGTIVVTRDFKVKSPRKYSFKDFGVLAAPPIR